MVVNAMGIVLEMAQYENLLDLAKIEELFY
jgi:hypothetical protein